MSVVSYEVAHALNQRAGRLGIPPATRVFGQRMKVHGELMEHGEVIAHPKLVDEGDELARRFIVRASARDALEEHAASEAIRRAAATRSRPMKTFEPSTLCFFYRHYTGERAETAMRGRYLGPAALIGSHGRSGSWVRFCGRAHLCATEHLRGVTLALTKGDSWTSCSGQPRRYRNNNEDLTTQPGPAPPVEDPTEPSREPEEPSRDDLDDGVETGDQSTPSEESGETVSSTESGGQSILWKERGTNHRQLALDEIPDEETAGNPQFKRARLEEPLTTNRRKLRTTTHHGSVPRKY